MDGTQHETPNICIVTGKVSITLQYKTSWDSVAFSWHDNEVTSHIFTQSLMNTAGFTWQLVTTIKLYDHTWNT